MPPRADSAAHGEEGTASVELVAVVPFLLLAMLAVAQIALAGQALWAASVAARAGARAADDVAVSVEGDEVSVRLRPPSPIPALAKRLTVDSSASARSAR